MPAACLAPFVMAGCATPKVPGPGQADVWTGRLSLRVDSEPVQTFAALFELRGAPGAGELTLTSPIGSTLGVLSWKPGEALLRDGSRVQRFDSIGLLAERMTGAPLPVDALFRWLAGEPAEVPGWRADLHEVASGRLRALRESPRPTADLRMAFEPRQIAP
ncbi:MAG: lipoprotein insertase outer membrane protein LolB [Xenophilus sp.]